MKPRALVLTGYGINCDYETDYSLKLAGFDSKKVHVNDLISGKETLGSYQLLVVDGGFSWADDHGAGVLLAAKLKNNLGESLASFISDGKLIVGICNGLQAITNLGILPGFDGNYNSREVALTYNDCGTFRDHWVNLKANQKSPCIFTKDISTIELPVRHGEGKFYASKEVISKLQENNQIVLQYATPKGEPANGEFPFNPNGSLKDIAAICDPTGRIFGLMPHPEAFNHFTNHPNWTRQDNKPEEGAGIKLFKNAFNHITKKL